ncbi:hypothetical protein MDV057.4 [Gallid alphaherpesvirus 2]|uniref:Uncharacterized protein n=1 Tax=Gallid alphaherpesvirus 2 TaxID=10390 RepID=A7KQ45_9ALPH|nr:hypothetical protein MDV057.4 [Gallid alphaherpesvirus 2]QOJ42178.1 hypothetical protein [synthetic construct]QOJ42363.1 hypothetical protein [synthetic construct]QOJ42547.1 hypothetical protein [synthetic construct]QOT14038.1 hypothetical protein [Gallid alphaherpesvirus 2]
MIVSVTTIFSYRNNNLSLCHGDIVDIRIISTVYGISFVYQIDDIRSQTSVHETETDTNTGNPSLLRGNISVGLIV